MTTGSFIKMEMKVENNALWDTVQNTAYFCYTIVFFCY